MGRWDHRFGVFTATRGSQLARRGGRILAGLRGESPGPGLVGQFRQGWIRHLRSWRGRDVATKPRCSSLTDH